MATNNMEGPEHQWPWFHVSYFPQVPKCLHRGERMVTSHPVHFCTNAPASWKAPRGVLTPQ